jgi:Spy/CpxP family protein refolding chaperone
MKRLMIAITAIALLATFGARAADETDQPKKGPPGPGGQGGPRFDVALVPPRVMDELKLTAEQKPKVEILASEFAKERDKLRASQTNNTEFAKLRDDMRAARDAGDREKMRSLREQLAPYEKPLLDLRKQYTDKVRALLTDEQKKTLDEAIQRRGPGGPRGMGGPPHGSGQDGTAPPPPPPPPPPSND